MVLVDTNVLLDIVQDSPECADWSQQQLDSASLTDALPINAVIYSELSIAFERIEELESLSPELLSVSSRFHERHCSWRARYSSTIAAARE